MAEKEATLNEVLFMGLILNLQASAMIAMGKITNPVTQKIERELDHARMTIDMLGMLEEKTQGNRTDEETRMLQKALTELRLNYLDELKKDHAELEKKEAEKEAEAARSEGSEPDAARSEDVNGGAEKGTPPAEKTRVEDEKQSAKKAEAPRKKAGKAGARSKSKPKVRKDPKKA